MLLPQMSPLLWSLIILMMVISYMMVSSNLETFKYKQITKVQKSSKMNLKW